MKGKKPVSKPDKDIPAAECPWCRNEVTRATDLNHIAGAAEEEHRPTPGCISLCIFCGEISTFVEDLTLEKIYPEKLAALAEQRPEEFLLLMLAQKHVKDRNQAEIAAAGHSPAS